MEDTNTEQLKFIDSRNIFVRIGLALFIILILLFAWISVRRMFGSMLAEITSPIDTNAQEIAKIAYSFSPNDPMTNWLRASAERDDQASLKIHQEIIRLSPNDYRFWLELGRKYEQTENFAESEKAFLKAIELAPNYAFAHWSIGNFYLRRGDEARAYASLKKAAEQSIDYRDQVFSTLWEFYDKDTAKLDSVISDAPLARAGLAKFYASREKTADALRIWNLLTPEQKQEYKQFGEIILQAFYEKKFYRTAIEFAREAGKEPEAKAETIQNGSFEQPFKEAGETLFGWRVAPADKLSVNFDVSSKKEGSRSLRLAFSGFVNPEIKNIRQFIAIESSKRYRLTFWMRTENLKSAGPPNLEIVNANDDKIIATTAAFPNGTNDWQQLKIEFTSPSNAEAIEIRTGRGFCGNACPIFGAVWYDAFSLNKL